MSAHSKPRHRQQLCWPVAALALGALLSLNPFFEPHLSFGFGIGAWFIDLALVLMLSMNPVAARASILLAGLFFAVPCFLWAPRLDRGLLMCFMSLPFALAVVPLFAPPAQGFRARLAYFFSWLGTQPLQRRAARFHLAPLLGLLAAAAVFAAALAVVKMISAAGFWLPARWLVGGIMLFAWAEMVTAGHDFLTALVGLTAPALMRSPVLSASIAEFWTRRWNVAASALVFRPLFFAPFARRGVALAVCVAFFASAVGHVLLFYMATLRWSISLVCGAFFLVQPGLIFAERRLNVRRWPMAAARTWTLAALAITSPLIVEPALQILTPGSGAGGQVLPLTLAALGWVMGVNLFFTLGQLVSCPRPSAAAC